MQTSFKENAIEVNNLFDFNSEVTVTLPAKDKSFPFLIEPKKDIDPVMWAEKHKNEINKLLLEYGAILIRGFKIGGAQKFNELFSATVGHAMEYKNRTSPRDQVFDNVYTSTNHPSDQVIYMHTENSYSRKTNRIISFYCLIPPVEGGQTPIADERALLHFLKEETIQKFKNKKIQYVRNVISGIGVDLKSIYQTDNKEELKKIFNDMGMAYEWISDYQLRLKWVLPAFITHPVTDKEVWFNHMFFGHKSLYSEDVLQVFSEDDLPFITYYGDGSEIEDDVIQEFKDFYKENSIVFNWKKDDFLLLDNMMYSHGRMPYHGDRTILTAMAQPVVF